MARFVAVAALVLAACSGGPDSAPDVPPYAGAPVGSGGASGGGTAGASTGGAIATPSTGGSPEASPHTGGAVTTEPATGGTSPALCRWSCLWVTRWSSGEEPVTATSFTDGVDCASAPAEMCTVASGSAIHVMCAAGDAVPEEYGDCLPVAR